MKEVLMEVLAAGNKAIVDIYGLTIDQSLPKEDKLLDVICRMGDPYHFNCKGITITAFFDNSAPPLVNHARRLFS